MLSKATIEEKNKEKHERRKKCTLLSKYVLYSHFFLLNPEARVLQREGKPSFCCESLCSLQYGVIGKSRNLEAEMLHLTKSVVLPNNCDKSKTLRLYAREAVVQDQGAGSYGVW